MSKTAKPEENLDPFGEESPEAPNVWPEGLSPDKPWRVVRQIELPPRSRTPKSSKYELHELDVNDAIETTTAHAKNVAVAARVFSKKNPGYKFITRKLDDDTSAIVRVA
jgi:hypothetical protein